MGVKIVLPNKDGKVKVGWGTKVYNDEGTEIKGVSSIKINIEPDEIITASIVVNVESVENLDAISAEFKNVELSFIEKEVAKYGYSLVKNDES